MFRAQTVKNYRRAEAQALEEMLQGVFPLLLQLQDGYHGAELTAVSVGPNNSGDGCMALGRVTLSDPVDTMWAEKGYGPGHYVMWGHGETPWQAICALEVELREGAAGLVADKYPPQPRQTRSKAPTRAKTHKGSKPYG